MPLSIDDAATRALSSSSFSPLSPGRDMRSRNMHLNCQKAIQSRISIKRETKESVDARSTFCGGRHQKLNLFFFVLLSLEKTASSPSPSSGAPRPPPRPRPPPCLARSPLCASPWSPVEMRRMKITMAPFTPPSRSPAAALPGSKLNYPPLPTPPPRSSCAPDTRRPRALSPRSLPEILPPLPPLPRGELSAAATRRRSSSRRRKRRRKRMEARAGTPPWAPREEPSPDSPPRPSAPSRARSSAPFRDTASLLLPRRGRKATASK